MHVANTDIQRALLRGRYMKAAARIEHTGVPMDMSALAILRHNWESIQDGLIRRIDAAFDVFEGRTFKRDRFAEWLAEHGLPWPLLPSGRLDLAKGTFKEYGTGLSGD